jgi:hypothetical protein
MLLTVNKMRYIIAININSCCIIHSVDKKLNFNIVKDCDRDQ